MTTTPTYSIVGSGNVGSALARIFARAHVNVTIANTRGPESLRELTSELGPTVQAASITAAIEPTRAGASFRPRTLSFYDPGSSSPDPDCRRFRRHRVGRVVPCVGRLELTFGLWLSSTAQSRRDQHLVTA